MERLVVAVDCDDVLLPSQSHIIEVYNQRWNTNVTLEGAYVAAEDVWQADPLTIAERIYDIQLSKEYGETAPFPDAIEVCNRLSKQHELHMVTARPDRILPVTVAMLDRYFRGVFNEIEHIGLDGSKGDICRNLQADVLIDDNARHLEVAAQCDVPHLIWFGEYPWQKGNLDEIGVKRCRDWHEVEREIGRIAARQLA